MSNLSVELRGKVVERLSPVSTEKYKCQSFVVEVVTDSGNGNTWTNYFNVQFTQKNFDKAANVQIGNTYTFKCNLKGNKFQSNGKTICNNNLDCWNFTS